MRREGETISEYVTRIYQGMLEPFQDESLTQEDRLAIMMQLVEEWGTLDLTPAQAQLINAYMKDVIEYPNPTLAEYLQR